MIIFFVGLIILLCAVGISYDLNRIAKAIERLDDNPPEGKL